MKTRFASRFLFFTTCTSLLVMSLAADYTFAKDENIYDEIQRFDKVLIEVDRNYVEEVSAKEMIDAAIEGMRGVLDPHTAYFQKDDYEELMVHTKAEFGGLGITISIRDKVLTVISPLPGTPASMMGILAGDRIVKIDGKSTAGITVDKAVKKLRGKPGTQVTITIDREGEKEPNDYTITRAVIRIQSVPYAGIVGNGIGYLRLVSFTKESPREVEEALHSILLKNPKGVILDLRNNPGGLLPSAIAVAAKFLPKGRLAVETKGRMRGQDKQYDTEEEPTLPDSTPLIVMVNEGSASASEIVAGAIQDWDRGVVMGRETYGKGSVQTVLPLSRSQKLFLKLTTAYYYTPSGRCINKPENQVRFKKEQEEEQEEADTTSADSADAERKVFHTRGGRPVYSEGGITPDIELEHDKMGRLVRALERKSMFFKYAIREVAKLKEKGATVTQKFEVTPQMILDFKAFVKKEEMEYTTLSEDALTEFEKAFEQEYGDSAEHKSKPEVVARVQDLLKGLHGKVDKEKEHDFQRDNEYIQRAIKREMLTAAEGEKSRYRFLLTFDKQIQDAVELVMDQKQYQKLLQPSE